MNTNTLNSSISALSSIVNTAIYDCPGVVTAEQVGQIIAVTAKALAEAVTLLKTVCDPISE